MESVSPESAAPAATAPTEQRKLPQVEHVGLDRKARDILKALIIERRLAPGEKIPQEQLAAELGISRTPLVNALKLLEKENFVEARPRRGYYVREFGNEEMVAVFEVREVLEGLAARKATELANAAQLERLQWFFSSFDGKSTITDRRAYAKEDQAFHAYIIEIGANKFLRGILDAHDVFHASYQSLAPEGLIRAPEQTIEEHLAIIRAMTERNADAAERLMRTHLANTIAAIRQSVGAASRPAS